MEDIRAHRIYDERLRRLSDAQLRVFVETVQVLLGNGWGTLHLGRKNAEGGRQVLGSIKEPSCWQYIELGDHGDVCFTPEKFTGRSHHIYVTLGKTGVTSWRHHSTPEGSMYGSLIVRGKGKSAKSLRTYLGLDPSPLTIEW